MELQSQPRRLGDRGRQTTHETRWFERHEQRLGPAGERRETSQPIGDLPGGRPGVRTGREVDHEDVDRAGGQQHPGNRETFVERFRRQHDEPVETDPAGRGFDRIERPGKIQPGHDRAVRLGLGDEPQGERRRPRRRRSPDGDAGTAWQTAWSDDRVQLRKAGPDDPFDASSRLARRGRDRYELGWVVERLDRERRGGQRSDHPWSGGPPPRCPQETKARPHVREETGHRTISIERMFCIVKGRRPGNCLRITPQRRRGYPAPPALTPPSHPFQGVLFRSISGARAGERVVVHRWNSGADPVSDRSDRATRSAGVADPSK